MDWHLIGIGTSASAAAGLATAAGALPIFFVRTLSDRLKDSFLGFAAGIMLAASFFSLILPGLEAAGAQGHSPAGAAAILATAILLGGGVLHLLNHYAPHEHFVTGPTQAATGSSINRIWLFVIAITIHNFPEGLAVGVSFGAEDQGQGWATAIGIGTQNMPEGLAVAVSLAAVGYSRLFAFFVALLTGLVEPIGGFVGISAVTLSEALLPWGLGFAGGAMIWVVSSEIIPETHAREGSAGATGTLMVGLALMMFLDWTLG